MVGPWPYVEAVLCRSAPPATLVGVYRQRNTDRMRALAWQANRTGTDVRLWALDTDTLPGWTRGVGPGSRFELLNRLIAGVPDDHWLVICDDDVRFCLRSGLRTLLRVAERHNLNLSQPAHAAGSFLSHFITAQARRRVRRRTSFVEIGPVVAIAPVLRPRLTPFPTGGMGWGLDVLWTDLNREWYQLGIVDAAPILHLDPPATAYDRTREDEVVGMLLAERNVSSVAELQETFEDGGLMSLVRGLRQHPIRRVGVHGDVDEPGAR